jgi:hypothetical protein
MIICEFRRDSFLFVLYETTEKIILSIDNGQLTKFSVSDQGQLVRAQKHTVSVN